MCNIFSSIRHLLRVWNTSKNYHIIFRLLCPTREPFTQLPTFQQLCTLIKCINTFALRSKSGHLKLYSGTLAQNIKYRDGPCQNGRNGQVRYRERIDRQKTRYCTHSCFIHIHGLPHTFSLTFF